MEFKSGFILKNSDALEELSKMKNNSVDFVITSPPYNMNLRVSGEKYTSRQIVKEFSTKYEGYDDNLTMEEYYDFTKKTLDSLLRVTKGLVFYNVQFLTGNKRALYKIIGDFNEHLKEIVIWDKKTGQPAMAERVMNSQYEVILIFSQNKIDSMKRQFSQGKFKRGTLSNVWSIGRGRSKMKGHSATFPNELINTILQNFTKKGEIILDPFMGTGVTGVCSIKNGRRFIGIELLKNYYDFAKKEIQNESKAIKKKSK